MHARCIRSNAIHRTTSFAVLFPIPTQQCDTLMHSCMGTTARCRLQSAPMHVQEYSICMYVPMLQVPSCHLFDVTRLRHFNSPASRCSCCVFLLVQLYILWLVTFSRLAAVSEINVSESIRRVCVGLVDTPSKRCVGCIESHRSRYDTGLASTGAPPTGRYRVATTSWNPTSSICHRFESSTLCMGPAALPCSCAIEARTICTSNGAYLDAWNLHPDRYHNNQYKVDMLEHLPRAIGRRSDATTHHKAPQDALPKIIKYREHNTTTNVAPSAHLGNHQDVLQTSHPTNTEFRSKIRNSGSKRPTFLQNLFSPRAEHTSRLFHLLRGARECSRNRSCVRIRPIQIGRKQAQIEFDSLNGRLSPDNVPSDITINCVWRCEANAWQSFSTGLLDQLRGARGLYSRSLLLRDHGSAV